MSGFRCSDCGRFVPHGSTHSRLGASRQCRTITERGVQFVHDWAMRDGIAAINGGHDVVPQIAAAATHGKHGKRAVPHRYCHSVIENAARELAGVNGKLVNVNWQEDEELVTVEVIVRKEKS